MRRRSYHYPRLCETPAWTAAEDARLADMIGCGLDAGFWFDQLPGRRPIHVFERRDQLLAGGHARRPRRL